MARGAGDPAAASVAPPRIGASSLANGETLSSGAPRVGLAGAIAGASARLRTDANGDEPWAGATGAGRAGAGREPPLPVLLAYARAGGISMESLVDDDLELPEKFRS